MKKKLLPLCFTFLLLKPLALWANPTGGNVVAGSASIAGQGTSTVTINQASNVAIINWQTFSIGSGESTQFIQPSVQSATLNRVLGGQTSIINGTISANGQTYLINGNGIVVGPGGVINANAFTGSTRDISDADFLKGNLHFTGSGDSGVQNFGKIKALGGDVVLIGKTVDNRGSISAPKGTAGLVAGDDILLAQKNSDGSTITVNPSPTASSAKDKTGVHNSGIISATVGELKAANGNIYALAIQNEGTVRATTVTNQGGHIWLTSDSGTIVNSGTLDASAMAAKGQGGSIILKSKTGKTIHSGTILARGGEQGVGGHVELSGAQLAYADAATVDTTARNGTTGTLLIDPVTFAIANSGGDITPTAVASAWNGNDVTYSATSSLTVTSAVSGNSSNTLALDAPTVNLNAAITNSGSGLLAGTATTVNVGANGLVQNGIDVASTTTAATVNLAAATYSLPGLPILIANKSLTLNGNGAVLDAHQASGVIYLSNANNSTVNLNDLTLKNGKSSDGAGLFIFGSNAATTIVNLVGCTITGNSASRYGGGIASWGISGYTNIVRIRNSTITGNSAFSGGGILSSAPFATASLALYDCTLSGNSSSSDGGGIENIFTTTTLVNCTLSGNTANGNGGGFNNFAPMGYSTPQVSLSSCTFSDNSATLGGGIFNDGHGIATLMLNNCTVTDNIAVTGGGIYNLGTGTSGKGLVTVTSSTVWANEAATGGGVYNQADTGGTATVTIGNTILAGTAAGSDYSSSGGTLTDSGYNLFVSGGGESATNGVNHDVVISSASSLNLGPLANNGGPTQTLALVLGSPAIDAGNPSQIGTPDQRGVTRGNSIYGTGTATDIGAYEAQIVAVTANNQTVTYGDALLALTYTVTGTFAPTLSGTLALITPQTHAGTYTGDIGLGTLSSGSTYLLKFTPGNLTIGQRTVTVASLTGTVSKTYDSTSTVNATDTGYGTLALSSTDILAADRGAVTLNTTGYTYSQKDVGANLTVTANGLGLSGNTYGDYVLSNSLTSVSATNAGSISAKTITVSAVNDSRTYNGTTSSTGLPTVVGTIYDTITTAASQTFDTKDYGTGKTLTASGLVINDGVNGADYSITYLPNATGSISKNSITVSAVTDSRTYNGTTSSSGTPTVTGTIYDTITTAATQTFDTKDFGTGKTLTAGGLVINDGVNGADYSITYVPNTTGSIAQATLTYVANSATVPLYSAIPTLTGTVTGFVQGENQDNATSGTLSFTTTATSGSPQGQYPVTGGGLTASNYTFVQAAGNSMALTIGPPAINFQSVLASFNSPFKENTGLDTLFTQSQFALFDPALDTWYYPVLGPSGEPHWTYSQHEPSFAAGLEPTGKVIAFGSSFTYYQAAR